MNDAYTADLIPEACSTVAAVVTTAAGADLTVTTPCSDFSLHSLLTHFTGTTGAFAHIGRTRSLNADDPWGTTAQLDEDDWPEQLKGNLEAISLGWREDDAWRGAITGSPMPARALGEMALIEVLVHGWDIAQATGQSIEVSNPLGTELLRCVAGTAELGRQAGAYGAEVSVAENVSDFAKALGLTGRNPS